MPGNQEAAEQLSNQARVQFLRTITVNGSEYYLFKSPNLRDSDGQRVPMFVVRVSEEKDSQDLKMRANQYYSVTIMSLKPLADRSNIMVAEISPDHFATISIAVPEAQKAG